MKNEKIKVLVTCPPMIQSKDHFLPIFNELGWEAVIPKFEQTVPEEQLCELVKNVDGWIIGDDEATENVVKAGKSGRLSAAVKWGIGVDNIDFQAFELNQIPIKNTPGMFNDEVADIAVGYLISLCRKIHEVDTAIREGKWTKPQGKSLRDMTAAIVGFGNIGQNLNQKLQAFGIHTFAYDPQYESKGRYQDTAIKRWPENLAMADFLIFTCSLNKNNHHMLNTKTIKDLKEGVYIVNVGRGPLIEERALLIGLEKQIIKNVALDVFEIEPVNHNNDLLKYRGNIFGSHNASNTKEAVAKTNSQCVRILENFLRKQNVTTTELNNGNQ